jgi:microcystin-dependent protein
LIQHEELSCTHSVVSTQSVDFGAGDGTTTFTLPNFKTRFAGGAGDLYTVGATGGSKDAVVVSHTHTATSTDSGHTHSISAIRWSNTNGFINNNGAGSGTSNQFTPTTDSGAANISTTVDSAGVSGTNANLPPYLSVYFIIKT